MPGDTYCTYMINKVAHCPPATGYVPEYFFSRYPLETSKLSNLINLLTPDSWFAYSITIILVIISLKFSCYIGVRLGLNTVTEEIALVPFRFIKAYIREVFIQKKIVNFQNFGPEATPPPPLKVVKLSTLAGSGKI